MSDNYPKKSDIFQVLIYYLKFFTLRTLLNEVVTVERINQKIVIEVKIYTTATT